MQSTDKQLSHFVDVTAQERRLRIFDVSVQVFIADTRVSQQVYTPSDCFISLVHCHQRHDCSMLLTLPALVSHVRD